MEKILTVQLCARKDSLMKLRIECECGNCMEVSLITVGQIAYFSQKARENDFDVQGESYDIDLLEDSVTDVDDVDVKIQELRIDCRKCGRYMILDCE